MNTTLMNHPSRTRVRSIFISDVHLGCRHSQAEQLLTFLKGYTCDYLYLVGDIIDGWKLHRGFHWNDTYTLLIRRIFGMVKHGTTVRYVAGNHDEFLRAYIDELQTALTGHIEVADEFIHHGLDGRRLLVIHGDQFDLSLTIPWLAGLGDRAYSLLLAFNALGNWTRRKLKIRRGLSQFCGVFGAKWDCPLLRDGSGIGSPYKSYGLVLKQNVKHAVNYINHFEDLMATHTRHRHCHAIICGHIHTPAIKTLDNLTYYNCGDWLENCTALVEHDTGKIELVYCHEQVAELAAAA
jgi:UDP-2,3-diacylglucosamine pyrophosphatase LpxH